MKKIYQRQAFTLVELIVVITILAVLGTIAFMAFSGYSKNARDSARMSDLGNMKKSLEFWMLQSGTYPDPSESEDITFLGGLVWKQGTFGESVFQTVGKIDKKPIDPLFGVEYTYSVTSTKKEYQLGAVVEKTFGFNNPIISQTYAAEPVKAYVVGSYNGLIATINATPSYIIALPSIILSDIQTLSNRDLDTIDPNNIVLETKSNLPASYNNLGLSMTGSDFAFTPVVVWSGSTFSLLNDKTTFQNFVQNLQNAYTGDAFTNLTDYSSLVSDSEVTEQAMKYAKNIIEASTKQQYTVSTIPDFSCASTMGYIHTSFSNGSPTRVNEPWQNANASSPCFYECTDGYSGNDCSIGPSCAEQPIYTNATFTIGSPLGLNQVWQNTNASNACYYECTGGYSGNDCSIPPYACLQQPTYTNATFTVGTPNQIGQVWQNTNASNACYYECTGGYSGNDCTTPPSPITINFTNPPNEVVSCSLCTAYNP